MIDKILLIKTIIPQQEKSLIEAELPQGRGGRNVVEGSSFDGIKTGLVRPRYSAVPVKVCGCGKDVKICLSSSTNHKLSCGGGPFSCPGFGWGQS